MDDIVKDIIFSIRANVKPLPIDIYIQPIFNLSSLEVMGGEVLARGYSHGSIVPFKDMIPYLKNKEIMLNLETHIINLTCSFIQRENANNMFFSINVSGQQLQQSKFSSIIENAFEKYNVKPEQLMFEVTCDDLELDETSISNLKSMEEIGATVAWDNISTVAQLNSMHTQFKVNTIKLKPGKIQSDKINEINSIINFANEHGMEIIAERLETMKQLSICLRKNIQKGQGYIYSRAVNTIEFKNKYMNSDVITG